MPKKAKKRKSVKVESPVEVKPSAGETPKAEKPKRSYRINRINQNYGIVREGYDKRGSAYRSKYF